MIDAMFLGTIIPLLFLIMILKGENKLLMAFFAWGLVAFAVSLAVNNMISNGFGLDHDGLSVTWAPIVEEFFKAAPLLYFLISKKNRTYPVIYFAMASGIGFSIQENYLYLMDKIGLQGSPVVMIVLRSITTCLMHGIATAVIGYGLQVARKFKNMIFPLFFGLLTLSVTLHALFNLYVNSSVKLLGMLLPIILYIFGYLLLSSDDDHPY